jgi:cytochrome c oxidase assembly protein subunit 15
LSTPYNRALHRFATLVAVCGFALLVAGALVTSNDAGLAVPDWPTAFGALLRIPSLAGAARLQFAHRLLAQLVGALTIVLAVWLSRTDRRGWVRKLGWAALATVVAQGVMGGLMVLNRLPAGLSAAHATLAQTYFCLAVALSVFTGRRWTQEPRMDLPCKRPSVQTLTLLAVAAVYLQVILGAEARHGAIKLLPHILSAAIVAFLVLWTIVRVLTDYAQVDALRRPAVVLLALLMVQLALGFAAWATLLQWDHGAGGPAVVAATTSHVGIGALVLATTLVLAIRAWRHVAIPHDARVAARTPKVVAV